MSSLPHLPVKPSGSVRSESCSPCTAAEAAIGRVARVLLITRPRNVFTALLLLLLHPSAVSDADEDPLPPSHPPCFSSAFFLNFLNSMTHHPCGHQLTSQMVFLLSFADSPSHCPSLSHCLPGKPHLPLLVYALLQSQISHSLSPRTCTFNSLLDILKFILSKDQSHPCLPSPPTIFSFSIPSSNCLNGKLHSQGILHSFIHSFTHTTNILWASTLCQALF